MPYISDGIRIGGIAGSIILGWRIYTTASNNAVDQERASQDRLEEELNTYRERSTADYAALVLRLEKAEQRLLECHKESAIILIKFKELESQVKRKPKE